MSGNRKVLPSLRRECSQIQIKTEVAVAVEVGEVMNEAEMQLVVARAEGARIAHEWARRNIRRFEPCEANSKLIGEWLKQNNLLLSEENLDRAAEAIGDRLARAPVSVASTEPTPNDVAPVPAYFPRLEVPGDIHRISPERLKQLRQGPHGENLKRRITALQHGFRNPVATPAVSQAVSVDDGLPPTPPGLDWSMYATVADIEEMPRPNFRLLYHSKKYGEAFRARIEAIYANERGQR
jgi:hypothetical protein